MRAILLAILLLIITGCAELTVAKSAATDRVAAAADEALASSELVLCRGITVGAWIRRYGNNPSLAGAWQTLCGTPITQTPVAVK